MLDVEQAIREVGSVYQALTGRGIEAGRSELPAEMEPQGYVEHRYQLFKSILASPEVAAETPRDAAFVPPMEVVVLGHEVRYLIDLPGVAREAVSVSAVGEWIVVRGRRGGVDGAEARTSERASGTFQRVIPLPPRARREGAHASLRDGVLTIGVPMEGRGAATRPIEIK